MTCSVNWYRRNEDGKREQIEFHLVREKPQWTIHRQRNEPREPYTPDEEDWDALLDALDRNLKRGKVYPEDILRVKQLRARSG